MEDKEKWWFTFGQSHRHEVGGTVLDRDTVVEIVGEYGDARVEMCELFGAKWSMQYMAGAIDLDQYGYRLVPIDELDAKGGGDATNELLEELHRVILDLGQIKREQSRLADGAASLHTTLNRIRRKLEDIKEV